jgi:hypothetical protein
MLAELLMCNFQIFTQPNINSKRNLPPAIDNPSPTFCSRRIIIRFIPLEVELLSLTSSEIEPLVSWNGATLNWSFDMVEIMQTSQKSLQLILISNQNCKRQPLTECVVNGKNAISEQPARFRKFFCATKQSIVDNQKRWIKAW